MQVVKLASVKLTLSIVVLKNINLALLLKATNEEKNKSSATKIKRLEKRLYYEVKSQGLKV